MKNNYLINKSGMANIIATYKYWFLFSIIIFIAGAFSYQTLREPIYVVSTIVKINSFVQNNPNDQENFQTLTHPASSTAIIQLLKSVSMNKKAESYNDINTSVAENNDELLISPGRDTSTLVLSVNTTQPQQAKFFLEKLLILTNREYHRMTIVESFNDSLTRLSTDIASKNRTYDRLNKEIQSLSGVNNTVQTEENQKQRDILKTIAPYLKDADHQYKLIPTTFPIKNPYINNLILQFNDAQSDKQHQLSENPDQTLMQVANNKIRSLQYLLLTAIDRSEAAFAKGQLRITKGSSKVLMKDSLSRLDQLIDDDIILYATLLERKKEYEQFYTSQNTSTSYNNDFEVNEVRFSGISFYFIAFLCGLLLPLGIIYFSKKSETGLEHNRTTYTK